MGDALSKFLSLPISSILIMAGLFLLVVGIVRKLGSWIELDKASRFMAGTIGAILLVTGFYMSGRSSPPSVTTVVVNPTPTFVPTYASIASTPTPEDAINTYYKTINSARDDETQYQTAWNMLSSAFRAREAGQNRPYSGYVSFWKTASPVKIEEQELLKQQFGRATVQIKLLHLNYPASQQLHVYKIDLVFDNQQGTWQLDNVCEPLYTCSP